MRDVPSGRRSSRSCRLLQTLKTALDAGCGVGFFAALLAQNGFHVTAFDAGRRIWKKRRRRHPAIPFELRNVEDVQITALGQFDLVLCFGLLYHLENPFRALRNLFALTRDVLLIEGMCVPDERACMVLRDECHGEDQGLDYVAFYPSESALIKMCYKVGFSHVYRFVSLPVHEDFRASRNSKRHRTVLLASKGPLNSSLLSIAAEPGVHRGPLEDALGYRGGADQPHTAFIRKPWRDKAASLARRWPKVAPWLGRS